MTISSIFQTNDSGATQVNPAEDDGDTWTDYTDERPVPTSILNFKIGNIYTAFRILVVVNVYATQNVSETFDLLGTYDGTNWTMSQNSVQSTGGNTNVVFTIDSSGQIKYTSTPAIGGFTKRIFKWIKRTL